VLFVVLDLQMRLLDLWFGMLITESDRPTFFLKA
jgi:hypothetical protein